MRKIAIVRRNGLGDLLCAFPLVLYFRKYFPQDRITLFVDTRNAPLLPFLPSLDQVVVFPSSGTKYWNHLKIAFEKRKEHFDLALSAKTSPMKLMNFFLFALGAKERVAYIDPRDWHHHLINRPVIYDPLKAQKLHQALKSLHLVDSTLQEIPQDLYPTLNIPEEIKERYVLPPHLEGPLLLLTASTTREESRLDPDRYAALVNALHEQYSFSVLIIGQKEDAIRAEAIRKKIIAPHYVHFPRNFNEFMVLLGLSDLYFVGDGGVGHIGAALNKKSVVLFGQTDPLEWHPLSAEVTALYHPHHVNFLEDEKIFSVLEKKFKEVSCGRDNR